MNAPVAITATFTAWRINEHNAESMPLDITASTLTEAVASAAQNCSHKDVFTVKEFNPMTGAGVLHVYRVKQSSRAVRVPHSDGTWRVIKPLEAQFVTRMALREFVPVEPWKWTRDCDVVGIDRTVLNPRQHSEEAW
jgi:hypothetical protein